MNTLKRTLAIALCLLLTLTCLAGCHKAGETAVVVDDYKFTSGYYACALVFADSEARIKVEEQLAEKGDLPEDIKYWKYKIDDTDYSEWVEETAINTIKSHAALKKLCEKANFTLSEETVSLANSNADYFWDTAGYSALMESNGVSKATFKQYMLDTYIESDYFEFIYGKDGEKAVAADALSKQLADNYVLVNKLEVSFSGLTDEKKDEAKKQFSAYEADLKSGSKTFEQIYLEYNEISSEDHKHEEAEEGESQPKDPHASVLGSENTDAASDHYETAKAMALGEIKLVTLEENEGLVLLVKQDISADPYYLDSYDLTLRHDIVGEEFEKELEKFTGELKLEVIKSSTKQFKVKNIKYPETVY